MIFLVTGANSYIGSRLVAYLLTGGHKVRCLVRDREKGEPLAKLGAEVVVGDITKGRSLKGLTDGIEVVYHLAGDASENAEKTHRVNVGGTKNLMEACGDKKIKALIFTSSIDVYGDTKGERVDEDSPTAPYTPYSRAKLTAENDLLDEYDNTGFPVIVLRLASVYGPGSPTLHEEGIKEGRFPILGAGNNWMNFIQIEDLLSILGQTYQKGKAGEIYIVSDDEPVTYKDFYGYIADKLGVSPPRHKSAALVKLMVSVFKRLERLTGVPPIITHNSIKILLSSRRSSNLKLKKDLGITLSFPTFREGLDLLITSSQGGKLQ